MRLLGSSIVGADAGFCLGTAVVECTGGELTALGRLPDLYHPRLDVYQVRARAGTRTTARCTVVQLQVQLARGDAACLEFLLWQRLRDLLERRAGDRTVGGTGRRRLAGV